MATVHWYDAKSGMYRKMVRGIPGIGAATRAKAETIGAVASARLGIHNANHDRYRKPNEPRSFITVDSGGGNGNAYVRLNDPKGVGLVIEGKLGILRGSVFG